MLYNFYMYADEVVMHLNSAVLQVQVSWDVASQLPVDLDHVTNETWNQST